jgi:hypothetical protein
MRTSRSLLGVMPDIAPRPVLLVAGGGFPAEIPASRRYRDAGGPNVQLWDPGCRPHGELRKHPAEYERRTIRFLDKALDIQRLSPLLHVSVFLVTSSFAFLALSPRSPRVRDFGIPHG